MMPIKYTDLLGPFQAIVEANSNYSFFYGSNLIPTHEDRQALALRKNKNKGSNLGILIGDGIGVDPRKVDHVIRSWFTFFGDVAIKTSDAFPREVPGQKRNKFNFWNLTGLIKAREPKNFTSMQYLQDKMKKYDLYDSPDAESIVMLIEQFDEEQTEEGRDELAKVIVTEAKRIEQAWKRNIKTYERVLNGENVPYLETELSKDNKKIAKDLLFNN